VTRTILALQSDKHAGHRLGLCNPEAVLPADDEVGRPVDVPVAITPFQRALWDMYTEDVAGVLEFAGGDPVIVFDMGDQTNGTRYPDNLMSTRMLDQFVIARANWAPWMLKPNVRRFRFSKGTGVHVFGEGSSETILAQELAYFAAATAAYDQATDETRVATQLRELDPGVDVRAVYHGVAEVDGVRLDYAHHGPGPGMRDWTQGNQVRYYLRSLILEQRRLGAVPADVYVRGHRHAFIHEALLSEMWDGDLYDYHMVTLPSYCGMGAYALQATFSAPYQWFGTVAVEVLDGAVGRIQPFVHCVDIRTWEVICG